LEVDVRRSRSIAAAVLAATLAASACSAAGSETVDTATLSLSDAGKAGRDVYAANCAACHGRDLGGGSGPALGPGSGAAAASAETLQRIITGGASGMPAWAGILTAEEIADVVTFLTEAQGR
jgi:mono/diheme cytochrome c family protein